MTSKISPLRLRTCRPIRSRTLRPHPTASRRGADPCLRHEPPTMARPPTGLQITGINHRAAAPGTLDQFQANFASFATTVQAKLDQATGSTGLGGSVEVQVERAIAQILRSAPTALSASSVRPFPSLTGRATGCPLIKMYFVVRDSFGQCDAAGPGQRQPMSPEPGSREDVEAFRSVIGLELDGPDGGGDQTGWPKAIAGASLAWWVARMAVRPSQPRLSPPTSAIYRTSHRCFRVRALSRSLRSKNRMQR